MPETELLDLTAEDVDEATWDQLVRDMFGEGPEDDADPEELTNSGCGGSGSSADSCSPDKCEGN